MRVFARPPHPALRATLSPRGRGIGVTVASTIKKLLEQASLIPLPLGERVAAKRTGEGFRTETLGHFDV